MDTHEWMREWKKEKKKKKEKLFVIVECELINGEGNTELQNSYLATNILKRFR